MSWESFYKKHEDRSPSDLYRQALKAIQDSNVNLPKVAIDLGCGNGIETLDMLQQGWRVIAIDQQQASLDLIKEKLRPEDQKNIELMLSRFEDLNGLPAASFIYAKDSLPFCAADKFPDLLEIISRAVEPGGFFAGSFFGPNDDWTHSGKTVGISKDDMTRYFPGFNSLHCAETEKDAPSAAGPEKHWHTFHFVMQKKI